MDPQNEPFPIAIDRQANGATIREIQTVAYPYFVDVRSDGMDRGPSTAGRSQRGNAQLDLPP